ncbi:MarR family winged helix-turn-helix transcriptional regulator [Mangrovihabitans endophyticus]|uniref:MarR family transcriptional regulator n=1 Tax=Mangrovihabitans endophyticus TaxID=1751298 RepID=A0A8J3C3W5_9ACTN|nr:MarR family transcriptional regulator [Mangrovihabitans endophyticus]GGL11350.1 MarR family transcriptional regulator [Mangrovihabitans endophyticus]
MAPKRLDTLRDVHESRPLGTDEEAAWRALARICVALPRIIDAELLRDAGLTLTEYMVLMQLSEAPGRALRMTELADGTLISGSGLTRLIERLERDGMVARHPHHDDGRSLMATLTDRGVDRIRSAWPAHLESVRRVVLDHIGDLDLPALAAALNAIVDEHGAVTRTPGPRKSRRTHRHADHP